MSDETEFFDALNLAVRNNNFHDFEQLVNSNYRQFPMKDRCLKYEKLLAEMIRHERREIFDFMLTFLDSEDFEAGDKKYAVDMATCHTQGEYYALRLIEKDPSILNHKLKLVSRSVTCDFRKLAEVLLEKGLDANGPGAFETIPILQAVEYQRVELTAILLYYGADPFIEDKGWNAFDQAARLMRVNRSAAVQIGELLCYYALDKHSSAAISVHFLMLLAVGKSPLFHELVDLNIEFDFKFVETGILELHLQLVCLFKMDVEYLRIILSKYSIAIWKLFKFITTFDWKGVPYPLIDEKNLLLKFNTLIEYSPRLRDITIQYISSVNDYDYYYYHHIICQKNRTASVAMELVMYLMQYGFECYKILLHEIYLTYGYCDLFKFLLLMDLDHRGHSWTGRRSIIVSLIYEVNLDLKKIRESQDPGIKYDDEIKLVGYFGQPMLPLPYVSPTRVPLLAETAREESRRYLVNKFNIRTAKEFYSLLKVLPINEVCKKIISYETKLYY